jgi:YesN/AraC family two-component response regulator
MRGTPPRSHPAATPRSQEPGPVDRTICCGPYDLLLTDVYMPDINGSALAALVRQLDPDIKVLCLTGYSDVLFEERGTLWENEAFVDKPARVRALREAVALLLSGHPGV